MEKDELLISVMKLENFLRGAFKKHVLEDLDKTLESVTAMNPIKSCRLYALIFILFPLGSIDRHQAVALLNLNLGSISLK